jgi:hypothetical protein
MRASAKPERLSSQVRRIYSIQELAVAPWLEQTESFPALQPDSINE